MSSGDATITITAKDLTAAGYASAKAGLAGVGQAAAGAQTGLSSLHGSLRQIDGVFAASGHSIGPLVQGVGDLADAAGKSGEKLGALSKAGLAVGAFMAGWQIGRAIADFFDLDQKIGNATAKLLGWGDVAGQVGGAKQDSINLAIKRGAAATTDYTAAIKFNTEWQQKFNTGGAQMAASVKATTDATTDAWKRAQAAAKAHAEELAKDREKAFAFHLELNGGLIPAVKQLGTEVAIATMQLEPLGIALDQNMIPAVQAFAFNIEMIPPALDKAAKSSSVFGDVFRQTFADIPNILSRAFEGGGGIAGALHSIALQVGADFGKTMSEAIAKSIAANGSAMSGGGIAGALGMGAMSGLSAASSGASTGQQLGQVASTGISAGMMASTAGATTAASIAFAAYTMGAGLAVIAAYKIYKAMNDGRKVMQDYYKTFAGGADELRTRMLVLGDEGERLWKKLTQQTGRGDQAGARAVTAEINAALDAHQSIVDAVAAAGFHSREELQATADQAKRVYDYMKQAGTYSAEDVAAAWEASQAAQRLALGQTADGVSEAATKITDAIKGIDTEMQSLSDSIAGEAPEEFMGVVEAQTRERMATLAAERDKLTQELAQQQQDAADGVDGVGASVEDLGDKLQGSQTDWHQWAKAVRQAIADSGVGGIVVPGPGGGSGTGSGDGGDSPMSAMMRASRAPRASGGGEWVAAPVIVDGQRLTEIVLRRQGRALAPYGIH